MSTNAIRLRKLQKREVEHLRDRLVQTAQSANAEDDQVFKEALQVNTRVDLPLGELANPEMSGLLAVWSMSRTFLYGEIMPQHQFNAQGLEGLVSIEEVPLRMALLAAIKTGLYRIEIFVPRTWKCGALRDSAYLAGEDPTAQDRKEDTEE